MSEQTLLNVVFALVNLIVGGVMKWLWDSHAELKASDERLASKVNQIEILVVGNYVKKDELERYMAAIFIKLDKIFDKLESKQDR